MEKSNKLQTKLLIVQQLIIKYSCGAKNVPTSFIGHIEYFKDKGEISASSISKKWHELTGENSFSTYAKGMAVIQSANNSEETKGCPYKFGFKSSAEIMPCLKHSRDTGIINKDGSINFDVLEHVLLNYFDVNKNSPEESKLIITQSKMYEYLEECDNRDKKLPAVGILFVTYKSIAKEEWGTFFSVFSDIKIGEELAVTAETFLLFYFDSATLYDKKLKSKGRTNNNTNSQTNKTCKIEEPIRKISSRGDLSSL